MKGIEEFCSGIKAVKYFSHNEAALERLGVKYKIFRTRNAAWDAARNADQDAAWEAAWNAAREAAWNAAREAAWEAAWKAAWRDAWNAAWDAVWDADQDAAWNAAQNAAWNAAWNAARDAVQGAALQCCMTTVCKDLDVLQEHRDYAYQDWGIWKAGYGVLGKVENVFYLYEKP